ncbi:MAG: 7-cyano-7-deazaguanine synthase [Thermogutta sp.]
MKSPERNRISAEAPVAVLLSGGLDSAVVLTMVAAQSVLAIPIYVRSGLFWEIAELEAIHKICTWFDRQVAPLVEVEIPVAPIYGDHWSITGRCPPDAHSPDEAVFLPGRNLLLLSAAGLWCRQHNVPYLAIGTLDSNPFADAKETFFAMLEGLLNSYGPPKVHIIRPLAGMTKTDVMNRGRSYPLEETFSCIAPVQGLHCGSCNKCAERRRAFEQAGIADRTQYVRKG